MTSTTRQYIAISVLTAILLLVLGLTAAPVLTKPSSGLEGAVMNALAETRVKNPVTAVLLDFRGYDTLLELGVLLLAWLGGTALVAPTRDPRPISHAPITSSLARVIVGPTVLLVGYLLWAGADAPGGAFQAGAVGAAAIIAWRLGLQHRGTRARVLPRWMPYLGFAVFLAVAVGLGLLRGTFLDYPLALVRETMVIIEIFAALSVAAILAELFGAVVAGENPR